MYKKVSQICNESNLASAADIITMELWCMHMQGCFSNPANKEKGNEAMSDTIIKWSLEKNGTKHWETSVL